jgi:cell division protein FtsW
LATWLESRYGRAHDVHEGLLPFLMTLGTIMFLMILQPDIGTMTIIVAMAMAVYFVGGAAWKHVVGLGVAGFATLMLLIQISPYRAARFTTFLHPELDPQGIGYHINQAFLAIGSGGLFGRGFGLSRQKFQYLPEVMGDSIFAILSEELGFFITAVVIGLFIYLMWRSLKIALACKDRFAQYIVVGIAVWITTQAFFNIGAMVGVLPLTGVPLPFISYGGTSLVILMSAMGIVANVSRHVKIA